MQRINARKIMMVAIFEFLLLSMNENMGLIFYILSECIQAYEYMIDNNHLQMYSLLGVSNRNLNKAEERLK